MNIKFKIVLFSVIFTNFSFADSLEGVSESDIEFLKNYNFEEEKNNFEKLEYYIQTSKIKRFFLQPLGFIGQAMNNFMNILDVTSFGVPLRKDHLMDSINLYTYFKRFSNKQNSEIMNKKFLSSIVFLESIYRIRLLYRFKLKGFSMNNSIWNYLFLIDQINNLSEVYLKGINFLRAFKK